MNKDTAQQVVFAVEAVQTRMEFVSAYSACKAAGVSFQDYKQARFLVYGPNTSV